MKKRLQKILLGLLIFFIACSCSLVSSTNNLEATNQALSNQLTIQAGIIGTQNSENNQQQTTVPTQEENALTATVTGSSYGKIAFGSSRDGNEEIYVMNADGSDQINLTNNIATDVMPAWSPDGSQIAFSSSRDGNMEIYVMNKDGSEPRRLTNNEANDISPQWSKVGNKIAFSSNRDGNYEIYSMNEDGSDPRNLTNNSARDDNPKWSPDGSKIAFESDRDGNHEIYLMNIDGSNQQNLTNNPSYDYGLTWGPDGKNISFSSNRDGYYKTYWMDSDGRNPKLSIFPNIYIQDWSPDGKECVYVQGYENDPSGNLDIYVMNSDGSNVRQLTNTPTSENVVVWSP
jgi:Tol biopolymer transport system component